MFYTESGQLKKIILKRTFLLLNTKVKIVPNGFSFSEKLVIFFCRDQNCLVSTATSDLLFRTEVFFQTDHDDNQENKRNTEPNNSRNDTHNVFGFNCISILKTSKSHKVIWWLVGDIGLYLSWHLLQSLQRRQLVKFPQSISSMAVLQLKTKNV